MAEIMTKPGYKWLYDANRAKISSKLQKEGADAKNIQKFFNALDKKKTGHAGNSSELAKTVFMDRLKDILVEKGYDGIEDSKKHGPKYAKRIKVLVRYKKDEILLQIDGKKIVGIS